MANGHDPDDQPILRALQEQAARRDATAAPGGGPRLGPLGEIIEFLGRDMTEDMERVTDAKVPDVVADASLPLYGTARRSGQVVNIAEELGFLNRIPGVGDRPAVEMGERLIRARSPEQIEGGFDFAERLRGLADRATGLQRSRLQGASEALQSERGRAIIGAMMEASPKANIDELVGTMDRAAIEELLSQIP